MHITDESFDKVVKMIIDCLKEYKEPKKISLSCLKEMTTLLQSLRPDIV